ncbi:geranylgeranyl diphosphate synthase 1 [Heterostelium album PN500]|uniref:Geranylgeranyl diphosphate synthase 1 n=1 Tax=Heterostelium pallidum (strain ATCC 26659 / Pp 5 / PN500) TaxID=670386 RepID=D3BSN3_HETP5|nr:geranylgeranyl diphosphate synthase 1 [Heterostelium album PN500]EFA75498.1 geranylgeranyl diphosphate synthase 1 [Heterostelium album PN500]|eukprot:XP_020427632.1 geranylgeranyl diphosphate synthase 1 [Heterostelium album PN500]
MYKKFSYPLSEKDVALLEPYKYISETPGKGIRTILIEAFNHWLKVDSEYVKKVADIVQALHMSSLLIDDIEDNSKLRRGMPVAHDIYGYAQTINCANTVYFLAMDECNKLGKPAATTIFIEEMIRLHRGQGYDILWRDTNSCPTEDEYKEMVGEKTGGLFRLGLRLLQTFSENKTDYSKLVEDLGLYYQIRDDYINLVSADYQVNKSFCEDITEGKFSFPIIKAIHSNPSDHRLLLILKQKTENIEVKQHALEYIKKSGALKYTKEQMDITRERIITQISQLGGNPFLQKILDKLDQSGI